VIKTKGCGVSSIFVGLLSSISYAAHLYRVANKPWKPWKTLKTLKFQPTPENMF